MAKRNKDIPTQDFVPVQDIRDGVVILKNGQMCMVLLASSINFALKSLEEQQAILRQFQGVLNTIDFSVQFYIQSRRLNIQPYLDQLALREKDQYNDLMRIQLREYMQFVKTFTDEVDIMSKSFFIVVPYTPTGVDVNGVSSIFNRSGGDDAVRRAEERFAEHRIQLEQRLSVLEQGLSRIGVRTIALEDDALVELFYHIFNPYQNTAAPRTEAR